MKVSIITINYNNQSGLQRTIDSVTSQSFSDIEWIVIDGDSKDGSRELIEKYKKHFAYWVSEHDGGIYQAMNKGVEHASGDWLLFLNSGDWLFDNDVLSKVFDTQHDADILYGDVMYHWPDARGMQLEQKPDSLSLYYFYTDYATKRLSTKVKYSRLTVTMRTIVFVPTGLYIFSCSQKDTSSYIYLSVSPTSPKTASVQTLTSHILLKENR